VAGTQLPGKDTTGWQVAILHHTSRIVSSGLSIDEMLEELIGLAVEVTACDACLVYLADQATGDIVLRASQLPHQAEIGSVRLNAGEGIAGWVAEHKSAVALSRRAFADPRFKPFTTLIEDTFEALVSVPLVRGGAVTGVFNIHHREPREYSPEEISLLCFLGEQMGVALAYSELAEYNMKLKQEAVLARRQLEERKLIERAKGILQQRFDLSEDEAYQRLRDESRRQRRTLRQVSEAVLMVESLGQDRPLPESDPSKKVS
jgi:signal transduction protein with GAF and PtsI domain